MLPRIIALWKKIERTFLEDSIEPLEIIKQIGIWYVRRKPLKRFIFQCLRIQRSKLVLEVCI